jgi:hypothetical protein
MLDILASGDAWQCFGWWLTVTSVDPWHPLDEGADQADKPTSVWMLPASGAPHEHYFEGMAQLGDMSDEERREWFIKNDNFFVE